MRILLLVLLGLTCAVHCKLEQVVSFFRHGARYPLNSMYDTNSTRYLWGELSSVGMAQHQKLGQLIQKQYIQDLKFLDSKYNFSQIEVYSTAINRTIQSVTSQLFAIYPLGTGPRLQMVDRQYYLPPFSNKTDDIQRNFALPNGHQLIPIKFDQKLMKDDCAKQSEYMARNVQAQMQEYQEMNLTYWPFIKRVAQIFNLTGNVTLSTLAGLSSDIDCALFQGRSLPADFTEDDLKNIRHIDSWYKQLSFVKDLARAINKYRFEKIINVFDSRLKNPNQNLRWTFLSGHDLDMVPMYNDLNLSTSQCVEQLYRKGQTTALNCLQYPEFASSLIFELYVEGNNHYVKIRANGKYMNLCGQKSTQCKYEDWKRRIQTNLASEQLAEEICGKVGAEADPSSSMPWFRILGKIFK